MMEHHPYGYFMPKHPKSMIIGSFPIGKFSDPKRRGEIKEHEMEFFFGGEKNLLWKLVGSCYGKELKTREEVIKLLEKKGIAIGDLIKSCRRKGGKGSDSDLYDIKWNQELLELIEAHKIKRLYFTSKQVHKWFKRLFPGEYGFEEIVLISPSAQSARSIVKRADYISWKQRHPSGKIFDFIREFYALRFT